MHPPVFFLRCFSADLFFAKDFVFSLCYISLVGFCPALL